MPQQKKDIRAFLGLVGYYRQFIPSFLTVAAPLTDLIKKGKPERVQWDANCDKAFGALKEMLISAPVLRVANPAKAFVLQTDASDRGLGAVLSQAGEDECEHPVAFASRNLLP